MKQEVGENTCREAIPDYYKKEKLALEKKSWSWKAKQGKDNKMRNFEGMISMGIKEKKDFYFDNEELT